MECSVCDLRGAVQSCSQCHAQLCEVCTVTCRRCSKPVCPAHAHKTHSGRLLCLDCYEERKAKREHMKAMVDREEQEEDARPDLARRAGRDLEPSEDEILTGSVRKPLPPWKLSLYGGSVGLVAVLVLLLVPSLRQIPLPGGTVLPTPYLMMIIPAAAMFWGAVGLLSEEHRDDRPQCLAGVAVAAVCAILLIVAVATDPARKAAEEAARAQTIRTQMTPEQLNNWRNERLERFRR